MKSDVCYIHFYLNLLGTACCYHGMYDLLSVTSFLLVQCCSKLRPVWRLKNIFYCNLGVSLCCWQGCWPLYKQNNYCTHKHYSIIVRILYSKPTIVIIFAGTDDIFTTVWLQFMTCVKVFCVFLWIMNIPLYWCICVMLGIHRLTSYIFNATVWKIICWICLQYI